MKFAPLTAALALATVCAPAAFAQTAPAPAQAQAPVPAPAPVPATPAAAPAPAAAAVSVETTPIDELLENEPAMAILIKHFPEMEGQEDQLAMAGSMTLRDVQAFAADVFTDEKLAALDADFKAMPAE